MLSHLSIDREVIFKAYCSGCGACDFLFSAEEVKDFEREHRNCKAFAEVDHDNEHESVCESEVGYPAERTAGAAVSHDCAGPSEDMFCDGESGGPERSCETAVSAG
ncbi:MULTISPECIES: hypothetical protein [unclassified Maridesulfovibrio]|uniref:hypothetical protein n=1 Tax=unclassified Maridesulfovibrio TaxID=2794999 RepID=UPI003B3DD5BB